MTTEELALEVERLRGVLARIEALVWYQPDDDDDLVEAVRVMACERNEARRDFIRVADALGLVSTDDTWRIGAIASVEDIVTQARHAAKALAREQPVAEEE